VAVPFANHLNTVMDRTIGIMNNPEYAFCNRTDRRYNQLQQKLLTWSGHVKSWVDESGLPLLVIRYEDMKDKPAETFSRAATFIGINHCISEIETALDRASFARLKQQEEEKGFSEKSAASPSFFRKGIAGDWKNVLSSEQVQRIIREHYDMMKRFGYLSDLTRTA